MASQEQLKKIVIHFLQSAPPGEFFEVVSDVRTLLKNDQLLNSVAHQAFSEYTHNQFLKVDVPDGSHKFLITQGGMHSQGEYIDPIGNCLILFDYIKQQVTGTKSLPSGALNSQVEPFRKAFESHSIKYVEEHYQYGAQVTYGTIEGGQHVINTYISSSLFNQRNFWGGRWKAQWTFKFTPGSNVTMTGSFAIQVHYYEEGNVQLQSNTKKTKTIGGSSDPESLAVAVWKAVEAIESDFQLALDSNYTTMGNTTFKALRRALPITRSKIDWDKIQGYRTGQSLGH